MPTSARARFIAGFREAEKACPCSPDCENCDSVGPCVHWAGGEGPSEEIPFQTRPCQWPGHAALREMARAFIDGCDVYQPGFIHEHATCIADFLKELESK